MSKFKLYDCDVGVKIDGVSYDFTDVDSVTIEDPEFTRLTRGANGTNKLGLVYKEGIKEPTRITIPILNMSSDLKAVLDQAYKDKTRMDVFCVSRTDGSSKMGKNSILCQRPQQLTLEDSPESMNVQLIFETFDNSEVYKD